MDAALPNEPTASNDIPPNRTTFSSVFVPASRLVDMLEAGMSTPVI